MAILRYILPRKSYFLALPAAAYAFGSYLDRMETERLSYFRDKSALYGRELKAGEKPTWP